MKFAPIMDSTSWRRVNKCKNKLAKILKYIVFEQNCFGLNCVAYNKQTNSTPGIKHTHIECMGTVYVQISCSFQRENHHIERLDGWLPSVDVNSAKHLYKKHDFESLER